jgi:hypothetical protein
MKVSSFAATAILFYGTLAAVFAAADESPVRVEARCPDKTIEYEISRHALAELQARKEYKVVADNTAEIIIRLSASPVRSRADDKGPPLGIALATLVQRRTSGGPWEVKRFGSAFVPLDDVQTTVKSVIADALK